MIVVIALFAICIFCIVFYFIKPDKFYYPDGKNGMIKVRKDFSGFEANVDSPRWQLMFLRNVDLITSIKMETLNKIANREPLTEKEDSEMQKLLKSVDEKYGTKEEILRGDFDK